MNSFCFKCKRKTNSEGIIEKITSNGRNMICGTCEICGSNKCVFVKSAKKSNMY